MAITVDQIKNFAKGILLQGYDALATTISFIPGDGARFPDPTSGAFNVTWWNNTDYDDPADDPEVEIIRIVAGAGDVKTIVRGQEGTAITAKNIPNKTYRMVLAPTTKVFNDIVSQAGDGTVQTGSNEGPGVPVFDTAASTASNLVFKTLVAGANIVITDNGTFITISGLGGGGGGYNLFQNAGVGVAPQTTIDLTDTFLVATDNVTKTDLTIDVVTLGADPTFGTALANNNTFITALVANNTFTTALAGDSNFITTLTNNATFQTNVLNFAGGSGSGGTKVEINSAQVIAQGGGFGTYTVNIPGGTLSTNNGIKFRVLVSLFAVNGGGTSSYEARIYYGGNLIAQSEVFNPALDRGGFIEGYLIADGATNAQKGGITFGAGLALDTANARFDSNVGSTTVDSTIDQNLEVRVISADNLQEVTMEGIIVERITASSFGNAGSGDQNIGGLPIDASGLASDSEIGIGNVNSNSDGTVIYKISGDISLAFSDHSYVSRFEKDTVTGNFYQTHNQSFTSNTWNTGSPRASCVVVGSFLYVFSNTNTNNLRCTRFSAADLSGTTAMTVPATATGGGYLPSFTDGTDVFVKTGTSPFAQFSISGTTLVFVQTVTGAVSNSLSAFMDNGVVYMADVDCTVSKFTITGSAFTSAGSSKTLRVQNLGNNNSSPTAQENGICGICFLNSVSFYYAYQMGINDSVGDPNRVAILKAFSRP